MADALTFSVGADTTKLRADLAVAQASVRQLGSQLRAAANESLKTGETSGALQTLASRFESASASVSRLRSRMAEAREATSSFAREAHGVGEAVEAGEIGLNRFSHAFGDLRGVIGAIAPEIREFAEAGALVALIGAANHASNAIHQLEVQAGALGTTTEALERWNFVAAQAGVSSEAFSRGLERFAAVLGKAQEAEGKLADGAGVLSEEQDLAARRQRVAADQASGAVIQAADNQRKAATAFEAAQLSAQKLTDSYNALKAGTADLTAVIAPNAAANDKGVLARERLNDSYAAAQLASERLAEAQDGIAAATRRANEAQAQQLLGQKEAEVAQDKLLRASAVAEQNAGGAFALLGIDPRQITDTVQGFQLVLEKLREIPDAAKRANVLSQLFERREWAQLAPLINLTSEQIAKLGDRAIIATEGEKQMADRFFSSWAALKSALDGIGTAVGNIVGQLFPQLFDTITNFFTSNQDMIRTFTQAAVDDAQFFLKGWIDAAKLVKLAFDGLHIAFNAVAADVNRLFGTDVSGLQLIVGLVGVRVLLPQITTVFVGLRGAVVALTAVFPVLTSGLALLRAGLLALAPATAAGFAPILVFLGPAGIVLAGLAAVVAVLITWKGAWGTVFKFIEDGFHNIIETVKAFYKLILSALGAAERLFSSGQPSGGGGTGGYAGGGRIHGPGTGTSDSIIARVSAGEYVVRAGAVAQPGMLGLLNSINAGRFALGGLIAGLREGGGFAMGGFIEPSLSFAGGGSVSGGATGGTPVHIHLDGRSFELSGQSAVVDELGRYATGRRMASGGRKPSWYGPGQTGG